MRDLPRARRPAGCEILSQLLDVPILLVHVSAAEAIDVIRKTPSQRAQELWRDLPAISVPDRRRHGQARSGRRRILLQPATARSCAQQAVCLDRFRQRRLPGLHPLTMLHIGSMLRESCRRATRRLSRTSRMACPASSCACRYCFQEEVGRGTPRPQRLRCADSDQSRQALRALSEEGPDSSRQRRRYRDLGPRA